MIETIHLMFGWPLYGLCLSVHIQIFAESFFDVYICGNGFYCIRKMTMIIEFMWLTLQSFDQTIIQLIRRVSLATPNSRLQIWFISYASQLQSEKTKPNLMKQPRFSRSKLECHASIFFFAKIFNEWRTTVFFFWQTNGIKKKTYQIIFHSQFSCLIHCVQRYKRWRNRWIKLDHCNYISIWINGFSRDITRVVHSFFIYKTPFQFSTTRALSRGLMYYLWFLSTSPIYFCPM